MENETLETIRERRSIRSYQAKMISDAEIEAILQAGIYAPSAMNQQEWHFTVVKNAQMLKKLQDIMKENMLASGILMMVERASAPGFVPFHNAPVLMILSADENVRSAQMDCGIAVENMALAAESLGIGSCIMTSSRILFDADRDGSLARELVSPPGISTWSRFRWVIRMSIPKSNPAKKIW
jgi:nitroreductase